ncbi:MAG TPA: TadE/TadG family type IV pilus assembly protein [Aestuariivirgaceae bacterium]|jgi:Flp pilus assembly protein TadG|nr:TadE/TadG family type IV pilus assembly protein [Aestuariivirgaceae bacterium]
MSVSKTGRCIRFFNRYRREEAGATAIEFAIVGGPFLYLLGAILEMGLMLFTEYAIEHGTAQAARLIRTGQVQNGTMTAADFKQVVCDNVDFLECETKLYVDVRKYEDFSSVSAPSSITTDSDGNSEISDDVSVSAQFDPGGPGEVVVVRVYYTWDLFMPNIPGMSGFSNLSNNRRLLSSTFAFMNEPYTETEE